MNLLWLIKTESYKRGILLSVLFNILAKGILFLLTILVAGFFGSNIKTDIYFFVYGAMVLCSGFINAIDTVVLIPQSMQIREKEGDAAATVFLNFFFRIYFLAGLVFVALMLCFGTSIFGRVSKFAEADILKYKEYFLLGSLYFFFQVLTNYINAILTSLKFFTVPMLISGINSCIVIAGILLLRGQFNVLSIFLGGIAAYSINLVLLLLILKKNTGWNFFTKGAPVKKRVWGNILYAELGQLATLASSFLPLYLLSGFGGGVISVMNYGKNIADIPNTLVTTQLGNVSGIQLNEQAAHDDANGMNLTFMHTGKLLLFILVPVASYLFVFAEPVVRAFYLRGNFTMQDVVDAAGFLRLFSLVIFSIGVNAMVTRIFIAVQAVRQAFLYQVLLNAFLVGAILVFTHYCGARGYPYGLVLMHAVNYILMFFMCKKLVAYLNYAGLVKYTLILLLIYGATGTVLYLAMPYLQLATWPALLTGFFAYLIVVFFSVRIFKLLPAQEPAH